MQSNAFIVVNCILLVGMPITLEFIASDIRYLLASFKLGYVIFLNRQFNTVVRNLVGLRKLFGARS